MNNYIMFEGRKIPLTEEQVAALKNEYQKENPFSPRKQGETYYYIGSLGQVLTTKECTSVFDREYFDIGNYCADEEIMKQRALHETLDRLLWRFSMENGELDNPWEEAHYHYFIAMDKKTNSFSIGCKGWTKVNTIYFSSVELAQRAISEIIEPFMKEHPDFVW